MSRTPTVPRTLSVAALALVLASGLVACAGQSGSTVASSKAVYGGTLTYLQDRSETCLDPEVGGDIPQAMIGQQVTDDLVYEGPGGKIEPWLAKSWTVSPNGLTYTFTVRDDVKFTDGTAFNAAAVKTNLDRVVDPKTGSSTDGGYIAPFYANSKVLSPYVLQVNLKQPDTALLNVLAQGYIGIESPAGIARGQEKNCADPIGTGPFKIQSYTPTQQVVLVKNKNYNTAPPGSAHSGPAYLDKIIWKIVPDGTVRYAALTKQQADVIYYPPAQDWKALLASGQKILTHQRPGSPNGITFNVTKAPLNDVSVRQAIIYASDEATNLKSAYFGTYPYVGSPLVKGTPDYDASLQNAYPASVSKANSLLDAAGWTTRDAAGYRTKNGVELKVTIPYGSDAGQTAAEDLTLYQDIQASEKKAGINIVLQPIGTAALNNLYSSHDYQTLAGDYWITNTPDVLRTLFSTQALKFYGTNGDEYSNPTLDKLLNDALSEQDAAKRTALYQQAQKLVSGAALQLNLYPAEERLAYNANVHGITADYAVGLPDFHDTWISK
ncbi:MAG: peptide/nickel transport system substrate-binding protein [Actinomycetota bacterium]|nr:peptide/nickel transport system substrate-binding protein [Actinomycetota bacterium]MDQ1573102.1 peptide/nickel transport system substrate-binding protein [Actinomycetota bacterium]